MLVRKDLRCAPCMPREEELIPKLASLLQSLRPAR
jgi:hypothetical protein